MKKVKTVSKIRLSLEPAFQIIYWSICWLTLFLSLILILENQHPVFSFVIGSFWFVLLYFGFGSTATFSEDKLDIRYFRGIKNKSYPLLSTFTKLSFSEHRLIKLEGKNVKEPLILYLNKKNKKVFITFIQQSIPEIKIEEVNDSRKNELNQE
ncbi:EbsA family protein [Carnobacterium funditum]|uniref:EbsA family protein n=1 Tax=Carnobacterium funditum TaxID=2752 RepID=UPI00054F93BA|nr:EbsA family protein [Carnobacterium funditum]